jgi:23S rRNA pseudouridine955/2504/2580 synthase
MLHKWIRSGQVRVNGRRSKAFARLAEGDIVRLPPFALTAPSAANASTEPLSPRNPQGCAAPCAEASLERIAIENIHPLCKDLPANPCREIAARRTCFAVKRQSQAQNALDASRPLPTLGPGLEIVAVSGDLLVLNKSAGLSCHPGSAPGRSVGKTTTGERAAGTITAGDSVSARLSSAFAARAYIPAPVHRLDRRTSGLLLAGLSHTRARKLHELFRQGGIARYYVAWSWGRVPWIGTRVLEDRVEKRLIAGRERVCALPAGNLGDPPSGLSAHVAADATGERRLPRPLPGDSGQSPDVPIAALFPRGREGLEKGRALCAARVVQRLEADSLPPGLRRVPSACGGGCEPAATLLLLRPLTGYKHQLRAQLAVRGFPLIGDPLYGGPPFDKLLLHACALRLPTGEPAAKGEAELFFLAPPWGAPFAPEAAVLLQEINKKILGGRAEESGRRNAFSSNPAQTLL